MLKSLVVLVFIFVLANGVTYCHRGIVSLLRSGKPQGPPCSFNAKSARPGSVTPSSPRCAPINLPRCLRVRFEEEARLDRHADLRKLLRNIRILWSVDDWSLRTMFLLSLQRDRMMTLTKRSRGSPGNHICISIWTSVSMSDDGSVFVTLPDIKISFAVWTCHCTCCCVWQFTRTKDL